MKIRKLFPHDTILVTKYFDAHQDWEVPINGFFIIAAKREIKSISDFTPEEEKDFMQVLIAVRRAMKEVLKIEHTYLFQNEASVFNFHAWFFPLHSWMEPFGKDITSIPYIIQHAQTTFNSPKHIQEVKENARRVWKYLEKTNPQTP